MFYATWWSLFPPVIAIALAFILKDVYLSLFLGVVTAGLLASGFHPWAALEMIVSTMNDSLDLNVFIFDVLLGMIIVLLIKSGGSSAYGKWASRRIHTKKGSLFATAALGLLIFVDDYFNCITVGSIMRPLTDKYGVSRAKLAYIIDSTAAPICIIAPISSWAAAINSYVPEGSSMTGFQMFVRTIPYNLYAILTVFMVFLITGLDFDFGLMKVHEDNAAKGDLLTSGSSSTAEASEFPESPRGTVMDLLIPVLVLIAGVVGAMIYTGFQSGASNLVEAFANCNAEIALIFGTGMTIVLMAVMYLPRGLMSFRTFMDSFLEGAKLMLPAMLILTLAWTLKGMGDHLGLAEYVSATIGSTASGSILTPAIMFAVAAVLAFATGTSYGTFAILLPIAIPMFAADEKMMIICVASILSGGVCGDHLSPISDTTIMSSAGAQSDHMNHVRTQIQYAIVVCIASVIGYLLAALTRTWIVPLAAGAVMIVLILMALKRRTQTVPVGRV